MSNRDLKNKLRVAFEEQTPDILSKIEESCKAEEQIKAPLLKEEAPAKKSWFSTLTFRVAAACAMCLILFVAGLSVGGIFKNGKGGGAAPAETLLYLDVNPSIELQLDKDDRVVSCTAGNEDAEAVLSGLELEGVKMNTAMTAIIGSLYVNGYLTAETNSVLISVDNESTEKTAALLQDLTQNVNKAMTNSGMECSIIAQPVEVSDELLTAAEANGVSAGKMHLVNKLINTFDSFTDEDIEDLCSVSVNQLNLIYSVGPDGSGEYSFEGDVISGNVGGFITLDDAKSKALLAYEGEFISLYIDCRMIDGELRIIYCCSVSTIFGECQVLIDCTTGKVDLSLDSNI